MDSSVVCVDADEEHVGAFLPCRRKWRRQKEAAGEHEQQVFHGSREDENPQGERIPGIGMIVRIIDVLLAVGCFLTG